MPVLNRRDTTQQGGMSLKLTDEVWRPTLSTRTARKTHLMLCRHGMHVSPDAVADDNSDRPSLGQAELTIIDIVTQKMEDFQGKRRARPSDSVEAHVMEHIKLGTRNLCHFTDGSPRDHPDFPEKIDILGYLKDCLAEVNERPLYERVTAHEEVYKPKPIVTTGDRKRKLTKEEYDARQHAKTQAHAVRDELPRYWTEEKIHLFIQALDFCRRYVIFHADITITVVDAVVNCESHEIRKYFATDKKPTSAVSTQTHLSAEANDLIDAVKEPGPTTNCNLVESLSARKVSRIYGAPLATPHGEVSASRNDAVYITQ